MLDLSEIINKHINKLNKLLILLEYFYYLIVYDLLYLLIFLIIQNDNNPLIKEFK
jgi:hypothetical protein